MSYALWSLFPIYWKVVKTFTPMFLLPSRVFSLFLIMIIIVFVTN